jgi:tetratricopeptide (TPR) repeat protein
MILLLTLTLSGLGPPDPPPDKNAIRDVLPLVAHDWWETGSGNSSFRILSLKPGAEWSKGTAWLINPLGQLDDSLEALQGKYSFFSNKLDDDVLLLQLCFTRKYKASTDGRRLRWEIDTHYSESATGVSIEIPLDERRVPSPPTNFVVAEAFFVDAEGDHTRRFTAGSLFSSGKEIGTQSTGHLKIGETLRLTDDSIPYRIFQGPFLTQLRDSPPPGFKPRLTSQNPGPVAKGIVEGNRGEYEPAILRFTEAISQNPRDVRALRNRGLAYQRLGQFDRAIADYTAVIVLEPDNAFIHNSAAWLLATSPTAKCRDGKRAWELAKRAYELTEGKNWKVLDTLAATYAETGAFPLAVTYETKALEFRNSMTEAEVTECEERLQLYREKMPYRLSRPAKEVPSTTTAPAR